MDDSRKYIVTLFVLGYFKPEGVKARMPIIDSIGRDEVLAVVLDSLLEHGRFPDHADVIEGEPPMYVGEQIRALEDGSFLVANVSSCYFGSGDDPSTRLFDNARDAVEYFVLREVGNRMYGVPVI